MRKTKSAAKVPHYSIRPLPVDKNTFDIQETSIILNKSTDTILRLCQRGELDSRQVPYGKKSTYLIPRAALILYLHEQQQREMLQEMKAPVAKKVFKRAQEEYLKRFRKALESGILNGHSYSPRTIDDYMYYLEKFFPLYEEITADNFEAALLEIPPGRQATKVHFYKAVLCFLKYLKLKGVVDDTLIRAIKDLAPEENKNPTQNIIHLEDFQKLEAAAADNPTYLFILRLLGSTGMRVSEACSLNWSNINFERAEISVIGKGKKPRTVSLPPKALDVVKEYYKLKKNPPDNAPILINRDGNRMRPRGIASRLEALRNKAGLTAKVHPHVLRSAFVTINAELGIALEVLQQQCGHTRVTTTSRYCRIGPQRSREIIKKVEW